MTNVPQQPQQELRAAAEHKQQLDDALKLLAFHHPVPNELEIGLVRGYMVVLTDATIMFVKGTDHHQVLQAYRFVRKLLINYGYRYANAVSEDHFRRIGAVLLRYYPASVLEEL